MARQPRIEYAGTRYHILARGNRRERIVHADTDRELFIATLGENEQTERVADRRRYLKRLYDIARQEGANAGKKLPEDQGGQSTLSRGWYWGSQEFRNKLLKLSAKAGYRSKNYRSSPHMKDRSRWQAEELIADALKYYGMGEKAMLAQKSGPPLKVAIVVAIKELTTLDQASLARRLDIKSAGNASQIYRGYKHGSLSLDQKTKTWLKTVRNGDPFTC